MPNVFLRSSDGNDADDGSTWALADATLAASVVAAGDGFRSYMSDNHAEVNSSTITIALGTPGSPIRVISVNDAGDPEPPTALLTGGSVLTDTAGASIIFNGVGYLRGITFSSEEDLSFGFSGVLEHGQVFKDCAFIITGTGSNDQYILGGGSSNDGLRIEFKTCTFVFGATAQEFVGLGNADVLFRGGSIAASGSVPTVGLFAPQRGLIELIGANLTTLGSSNPLVNVNIGRPWIVRFVDCRLGSGFVATTGTFSGPGSGVVEIINCDSGDTQTHYERHSYRGVEMSETGIFLNATDGTTPHSRQMVSTANVTIEHPMESGWRSAPFNTVLAEVTLTVQIVHDSATDLDDDECWVEGDYQGTSGFPQSVHVIDRLDDFIFGTPAAQASSSASWTGTSGFTNENTQQLVVTFTPQEIGLIRFRVMLADPSKTIYFDPRAVVAAT